MNIIYTEPNAHTITALKQNSDCHMLYNNLPLQIVVPAVHHKKNARE